MATSRQVRICTITASELASTGAVDGVKPTAHAFSRKAPKVQYPVCLG